MKNYPRALRCPGNPVRDGVHSAIGGVRDSEAFSGLGSVG